MRRARMAKDPGGVPEDFLTLLLQAEGPDGLTRGEIEDNIITFIGAGHETTARALGWTLYCLAEAPWERAPIEAGNRRRAGARARPDEVARRSCRLLAPPSRRHCASIRPRRRSTASRSSPSTWRDLKIPAKAAVLVMPWTVHRHRKLRDQPDAFMPSRFHPENRQKIDRYQYLPFGAGPRVCIGASFAMQEAIIALAVLLGRFRFDTVAETKPWPVQKLTTQPQGGLPMKVTARRWRSGRRRFRHEQLDHTPLSLMVIGLPKRSLNCPPARGPSPSLTQYSETSVRSLPLNRMRDAALEQLRIVEGAALFDAQSVGKGGHRRLLGRNARGGSRRMPSRQVSSPPLPGRTPPIPQLRP